VADAHPHRFRRTFAVNFLRNGGNPFALQRTLEHESLEMVKHGLSLAQTDLEKAHQDASPVANWLLWLTSRASSSCSRPVLSSFRQGPTVPAEERPAILL